jgi:hypothetical protein
MVRWGTPLLAFLAKAPGGTRFLERATPRAAEATLRALAEAAALARRG